MTYKVKNGKDYKCDRPELPIKPYESFEKCRDLLPNWDMQDNYSSAYYYENGTRLGGATKGNCVENTSKTCIEDIKLDCTIEIKNNEELIAWHQSLTRNYNSLNSGVSIDQIVNLFNQLNSFSQYYHTSVQNILLENFKNKSLESVKTETSCICISINIINELMKIEKPLMGTAKPLIVDFIFMLVTDLKTFVNSIPIARRLVEMSLYCLCNYYNYYSTSDQKKIINIGTDSGNFQNDLYELFLKSNSKKIKISSSILLVFIKPITNFSLCEILDYLESIIESDFKNSIKNHYYGIKKDLILISISKLKK